jgi:outer membrane protein OmpA-like peptidoglycan-associated protein
MAIRFFRAAYRAAKASAVFAVLLLAGHQGWAQATPEATTVQPRIIKAERYVPTIWVDPDGCEHWVMDDGVEGYMTPNVSRDGIPFCHRAEICGVMNTDQFFATDRYAIGTGGKQRLVEFFNTATAAAFIILGHTDSTASDSYNLRLSQRRANAVARIAQSTGARVADVRGYGERQPKASNDTAAGRAQNRRVEIICLR